MHKLKKLLKKLIPKQLLKLLLKPYHFARAILANMIFGWPGRGMKVVMITGTNGKTTTSALLAKIFEARGEKVGVSTTAFFQVGDKFELNALNMTVTNPFAVQKNLRAMRKAKVDRVVFEQTAHGIAQYRALGVPYEAAAVTNLTQDHLDYFGNMDHYAETKARLLKKRPNLVVLNRDDEWFNFFNDYDGKKAKLTFGTDHYADCKITKAVISKSGSRLTFSLEGTRVDIKLKLIGKFNAYNALCAATIAHGLGVEPDHIKQGLEALHSVPGRMESIENKRGLKIIVDYAHAADSLEQVLHTLRDVGKGRLITVFGATGDRDKEKRPIMGEVVARLSDVAIVTDDEPYSENPLRIREEVLVGAEAVENGAEVIEIGDRRGAIQKALMLAKRGDIIFVAGMGSEQFRTIGDGVKEPWDEREVVRELLTQKRK